MDQKTGPANFLLSDDTVLGEHEGYPFYTIGQRHGLGLAVGEPIYVTRIDAESNTVWVGPKEELLGQRLSATQINPIKYADLTGERDAVGKIRYKDEGAPCVAWQDGATLHVQFAEPRRAITPGQAIVLYEGEDVLVGAWIQKSIDPNQEARPHARA